MKCSEYKNMTAEYISGEIDEKRKSELEKHLQECGSCSLYLKQEKTILKSLEYNSLSVPERLNENIIKNLPFQKHGIFRNIFKNNRRFIYAAASVFVLTLAAVVVLNNFPIYEKSDFISEVKTAAAVPAVSVYASTEFLGESYDDVISSEDLFDKDKWSSDSSEIFSSESEIVNGMITLEELESYDNYLSSL